MPAPKASLQVNGSNPKSTTVGFLEAMVNAISQALYDQIGAIATGLEPAGNWDASSGAFPSGSDKGTYYVVSTAGTVDGQSFAVGDWLIPLKNNASTSNYANNWFRADYSKVVPRNYTTVADLQASLEPSRGVGSIWEAQGFRYEEVSSGEHLTTAGGVKLKVLPGNGAMPFLAFGPANNGVTDDSAIYATAKAAAEAENVPLDMCGGNYGNTSPISCPTTGFVGKGTFSGEVRFANQRGLTSAHQLVTAGHIVIAGLEYGYIGPVFSLSGLTINGIAAERGMYWTKVERMRAQGGPITIDVTSWPCNQNIFMQCRGGGVNIVGSGTHACDANRFIGLDTTDATLTGPDGKPGYHVVDANGNGANVIEQWYAEGDGNCTIYGAWDIDGARVNEADSAYSAPPNRALRNMSGAAQSRNISDYQPITANMAEGGDWSVVDVQYSNAKPPCVSTSGAGSTSLVADANDPSGLGYRFQHVSSAAYGWIGFEVPQYNGGFISAAFWAYCPDGIDSILVDRGGTSTNNFSDPAYYDAGNGWRLYRISSTAPKNSTTPLRVRIAHNTGEGINRTIGLSCIWASNFKTMLLPTAAPLRSRRGFTPTGAVNDSPVLPVGAMVENRNLAITTADPALWVKTASGLKQIATVS
ncbi:hypothetical protein [Limimaricola cinnabarinus]|uniref:hypothetical protein n=1 Tax=Limimaricola cinnabarinus TaxID=1125964 RepID=UPI0024921F22|nr:hypothetical protein [Limimaricola cinnabarinus]